MTLKSKTIVTDLSGRLNTKGEILLNERKNEFYKFEGNIEVPRISVNGISSEQKIMLSERISRIIPEFLNDHSIIFEPKPAAETLFIHFAKHLKGRQMDFIHLFKIDFKFSGNPDSMIEKGDNFNYPSYCTDRFYYKSYLLPVYSFDEDISEFRTIPLFKEVSHKSENDGFFTYALFDDVDVDVYDKIISESLKEFTFPVPKGIFRFISYAYFTAAFTVLNPFNSILNESAELFEIIFLKLMKDNDIESTADINAFSENLYIENGRLNYTDSFIDKFNRYLGRYSLITNEEYLLLNSWKKIETVR
ncbi:MAG: hypothetical protein KA015_01200 [Spirochaetes bacterium]|nr:hypothetical protein [Spirochaetota bacterium]